MLTKKQKQVARAVFEGIEDEEKLAERFEMGIIQMSHLLANKYFQAELDRLCNQSSRQARCTIARYGPVAAMKLAVLLGSEKDDTARRAALDLIDRSDKQPEDRSEELEQKEPAISDDQAREMLKILAEGVEGS